MYIIVSSVDLMYQIYCTPLTEYLIHDNIKTRKEGTMKDETIGARMKKMRESRRRWIEKHAYGLSPDGLIGALVRGDAKIIWVKPPEKKVSKKK
jgi:hypothetical protein